MDFNDLVLTAADDTPEGTNMTFKSLSSGQEEFIFYTTNNLPFDLFPGRTFRCSINDNINQDDDVNKDSFGFDGILVSFVASSGSRVAFTFMDATIDKDDIQVDNTVACELNTTLIDRLVLGRTYIIELTPQN